VRAEVTGSDVCAATGINPLKLVWLFQNFQNASANQLPQMLSDHPGNGQRVETLKQYFKKKSFYLRKI
jgi:predicted Zn-dependent protease